MWTIILGGEIYYLKKTWSSISDVSFQNHSLFPSHSPGSGRGPFTTWYLLLQCRAKMGGALRCQIQLSPSTPPEEVVISQPEALLAQLWQ